METNKEFKNISRNALIDAREDSFELEFQESLPQYCEDIEQVIRCCCSNVISDYEYAGGTLKIYGKSRITILYLSTSKYYLSAEFEETFTKNIDAPVTDCFAFASINACTRFTNFRLINQRKIEVRSSIKVVSRMYERRTESPLISCSNAIVKTQQLQTLDVLASAIASCDFDEEFSIGQHNSNISVIMGTSSYAVIDELRMIKDKMLLKCRVELCVMYTNTDGGTEKCCFSVNCTKIIDISGIDESCVAYAFAKTASLFVKAVPDNDNNLRKLEVAGNISVSYVAAQECTHDLITDAYAVDYCTDNQCQSMTLNCHPTFYFDSKTLTASLTFEDEIMAEIIDVALSVQNAYIKSGNLIFEFMYTVTYYDANGSICCKEGMTELSLQLDAQEVQGIAGANLLSYDYLLQSANALELRINMEYNACLYSACQISYLTDIELKEAQEAESPVLTVYFASDNETVWDIAKKFRTDSSLIMKENELTSEEIKSRRILLIPGV